MIIHQISTLILKKYLKKLKLGSLFFIVIYCFTLIDVGIIIGSEYKNDLPFTRWLKDNENRLKDIIEEKEDIPGHISKAGIRYLMFHFSEELKTVIKKHIINNITPDTIRKLTAYIPKETIPGQYTLNIPEDKQILYIQGDPQNHPFGQLYADKINKHMRIQNSSLGDAAQVVVDSDTKKAVSLHYWLSDEIKGIQDYPVLVAWEAELQNNKIPVAIAHKLSFYQMLLLLDVQNHKDTVQNIPPLTSKALKHYIQLKENIKQVNNEDIIFDEEAWQRAMSQHE
jgi:hypothetical protein